MVLCIETRGVDPGRRFEGHHRRVEGVVGVVRCFDRALLEDRYDLNQSRTVLETPNQEESR